MPHGNKKSRASNPKKKGNKSRPKPFGELSNSQHHATTQGTTKAATAEQPDVKRKNLPILPTFRNNNDDDEDEECGPSPKSFSLPDHVDDSLYVRSKKCTQRFKERLQSMVPSHIFCVDDVNELMTAAEYVAAHDMDIDHELFHDLKLAISVRKRVAKVMFNGGDEGHSHFISVLIYCWSILSPKRKSRPNVASKSESSESVLANRFGRLSVADGDDENEEVDLPCEPVPRPRERIPTRLTMQELISGSDRLNTAIFFVTLDELMRYNADEFERLKEESATTQHDSDLPCNMIVEQLIESSVNANLAVQLVASLEQVFVHDHPHLNTPYRMIACFEFVRHIEHLTDIVSRKSPIADKFSEKQAIEFLGDAIECFFRSREDLYNKRLTLVDEFHKRWQFNDDDVVVQNSEEEVSVRAIFESIVLDVVLEVPLYHERCWDVVREFGVRNGIKSHSWLSHHPYIGANRSIVHTMRLLQGLSNVVQESNGRLISWEGTFGRVWMEHKKPVSSIQIDMDDLLVRDILPTLIYMCQEGMLSMDMPYQDELLTVFAQIKSFIKYPERPITWSQTFAIHSILTSIFEVQGSDHITFLSVTAKRSFEAYFDQLEWVHKMHLTDLPVQPPVCDKNMSKLESLRHLVDADFAQNENHLMRAVWNPYCAGCFLSYIAFYGNLDGGRTLVDSVSQLRATLHLFSALRQLQAITPGSSELLDMVYDTFKDCKAIWEGPIPLKGQFETRWWIALGVKVQFARKVSGASPAKVSSTTVRVRERSSILPGLLSKSYRKVCLHDFNDVATRYHEECPPQPDERECLYHHYVRLVETSNAIERDQRLLGTNLVCLGYYLNKFFIGLFDALGWMPLVEMFVNETHPDWKHGRLPNGRKVSPTSYGASDDHLKYQAMYHIFADMALGPLDAGDDSVASACATYMKDFFNNVPARRVMWFFPMYDPDSD